MKTLATIHDSGGRRIGIVSGHDAVNQQITVKGRIWRFHYDLWNGPMWLRKDGELRRCQSPHKAVWKAYMRWETRYRKEHA